jgi:hypothetical protein
MAGHRDDGTFAEDQAHHPGRRPPKMEDYLGRLLHPPKRDYATALSDAIMSGEDHPEPPETSWAADVQRKTMTYMGAGKAKKAEAPKAEAPAEEKPKKKSSGSFNPTCGTCKGSGANRFSPSSACLSCKGDGLSPRGRKFLRDEIGD